MHLKHSAGIGVVTALAVAAGIVTWLVVAIEDESSTEEVSVVEPIALSESGLRTLADAVGQPIYWAGPRKGYRYELRRTAENSVYVRYLPPGVQAGAEGAKYLLVATYPFLGALESLQKVAGGDGIQLAGGGLALVDPNYPNSIHLAFPSTNYQVEVYDPSPERALEVASSGRIEPIG